MYFLLHFLNLTILLLHFKTEKSVAGGLRLLTAAYFRYFRWVYFAWKDPNVTHAETSCQLSPTPKTHKGNRMKPISVCPCVSQTSLHVSLFYKWCHQMLFLVLFFLSAGAKATGPPADGGQILSGKKWWVFQSSAPTPTLTAPTHNKTHGCFFCFHMMVPAFLGWTF